MSRPLREPVRIVEVGPRDGLQNVASTIPTPTKIDLIQKLRQTGLNTIELTSVVSPKAIPQLADCRAILSNEGISQLIDNPKLRLPVLIPNLKGLDVAINKGVKEVAVFVSAAEGFSKANINCSVQQGLDKARSVAKVARERGMAVRGYISCIFACPYDGPTPQSAVLDCARQLLDMGCYEISLGDTLGVGVAANVKSLLQHLTESGIPIQNLAGHFHDTYGQAVSNVWTAYELGMRVFDSSVGGLGGCPFAPGAKGNVASEDLVYMFQQAGVETGVDLTKLVDTGVWISKQLSKGNESRAGSAIAAKLALQTSKSSKTDTEPPKPSKDTKQPQQPQQQSGSESKPQINWILVKGGDESLEIHKSGPNIKIVLNRPRNGNALTKAMINDLRRFFDNASSDSTVTRIAITGKGKYFCTGMDLAKDSTAVSRGGSSALEQYDRLFGLFEAIHNAPQVTIAAIQGSAFGGGIGLAFACDVRIAVKAAAMTLSEVRLGLTPATISKHVIREWGVALAREAMLTGRPVAAPELQRLGLVAGRLADDERDLAVALDAYITRLKAAAPRASALAKELVRLHWVDGGGGEKQRLGIRAIFDEMMAAGAEGEYGVKQFQQGNKRVDWDARVAAKAGSKL